jgi:hypothetical protein
VLLSIVVKGMGFLGAAGDCWSPVSGRQRRQPPVSLVGGLADAVPRLALIATERLRDDHMWLRYAVAGS